ncbi:pyridoxamine 5'-phosphate oxidase family protein [Tsukamurella sp. 8F]|uniref:pyridoxamine 5'-phosphate oxidase family protein n=1 Tax=unclassified Tsukamurella TaxID=2633480 RepID=UPI0023B9CB1D|nr:MULTISPECIES: pyridoxamine 5'-phosphate oxidase family protein [unclassified Tsukamurella]MDF0528477.1 pyridoxamine 5'-phosphate oxidase family protein [Tsukamurella sp. 8J]MDF0586303.1 pyridoxamine 5'-phosphate oxidase family protein [Tsukamurella sp. 8F]
MGHRYQHIAFGAEAVERQREAGSIVAYGAGLETPDQGPQELTTREVALITSVFQFHIATVAPSGWPYVQCRSGPRGFLHHLGGNRIGFADFRGNRQFVSVGNLEADGRVALFVADYARRLRLKVFGHAHVIDGDDELLARLRTIDGQTMTARCERSIVIDVEAFDWNCQRSLVPQLTVDEVRERVRPYAEEIISLRDRVAELERRLREMESPSD